MSELPLGWVVAELGDLVEVLDSRRVPVNASERALRPGNVPYFGATGQVGWIDEALFEEELVLLGEDGAPFLDPSKPKAYLINGPSWVNNHAHVLRAWSGATTNRFLKYALDAVDYRSHVNGTTRLKLTQKAMNAIRVPLPPAAEQERVVAAIEEHLSRLDAAEEGLRAGRGKIDAVWCATLRHTIAAAARLSNASGIPFDQAFAPVGSPGSIAQSDYLREGVLAVVDQGGGLIGGYTNEMGRRVDTDLPVIVFGDHTRRIKYVDFPFAMGASGTKVLRPSGQLDPRFAYYALSDAEIEDRGYGRHYSLLRRVSLPDLPTSAQHDVVRRLDRVQEDLDRLRGSIDKGLLRISMLRHSILAAAFSGQLVPQDPEDEPASVLLERIRAEREAATPTKRTRKAKAS